MSPGHNQQEEATSLEGEAPAITGCYKQYDHSIASKNPESTDPDQVSLTYTQRVRLILGTPRYLFLFQKYFSKNECATTTFHYAKKLLIFTNLKRSVYETTVIFWTETHPIDKFCTRLFANAGGHSFRTPQAKNADTRTRAPTRQKNACS